MRVLGIDPGIANLGWGIIDFDGTRFSLVASGLIKTSASDSLGSRLLSIYNRISDIIEAYHPEAAAVEDLFFNKNVSSAIPVAKASGVVELCISEYGLELDILSPKLIKQTLTGTGSADKNQVLQMVTMLLGLDRNALAMMPDHVSDAIAIAMSYCHSSLIRAKISKLH